MSSAQRYIGVRFDGAAPRGHVESYFVKANDPASRRAIWLRTTIFASERSPDRPLAEAWAIAFDGERNEHVAVKSMVPYETARFSPDAIDVAVDGCSITATAARGAIESGGRRIAWDLALSSGGPPVVHFPSGWMYDGPFPRSKLVSPLPDLRVTGRVEVNGRAWDLEGWPGLLGHNWGRQHALLYAWGHCNVWDGPPADVVFEGFSAKVALGPVASPMTTVLCLRHRGVRYDLNGALSLATNSGKVTPRRWKFHGKSRGCTVDGEMWGETDDFVGLFYPNPDGKTTYCLNTKIGHARLDVELRGRPRLTLRSRAAALEIATRDPHHGVRMYV